ncbi:MAG: putative circularly permuted ATP-grasp superfamily protein, partial [Halioglobus sp.]
MTTLNSLPSDLNESTDADGNWHEAWSPVLTALSHFDNTQITSCQHELQRRYRENGLAFGATIRRKASHRPWNLDLMPQMMAGADWQKLESGLQQRARLKSALLKDLYGEQRVLHEGIIPAKAVFAHNGFIEAAVGIPIFDSMSMYSADVSRSPSGDWYVADDICQAPNGIGYALENRLILSGVLSSLYRHSRVRRLAEYFKHMRNVLFQHVDSNARCVILGYGASHHYHFEQAYLSKYLGYTLIQINDLTVRGKHAWLKTVDGMQRVDVIFRFVDDADIDPLAGDGNNTQGVPGLLHASREGGVIVVNPIGAAAVENPAFNAWLPELCQFLLDEPIELLGTPTYWLGNEQHKLWVENHFKNLLIRDIDTRSKLQDPALMSDKKISSLRNQIEEEPERFIAQERIGRSSTPTLINETIEPRQLTMRMYLMSKGDSYRVMPGGLGLLDMQIGGGRRNIREMESSKDIWVVSDKSVPHDTLLDKNKNNTSFRIIDGELPSSVAESLFWLGRYAERIESSARLLLGVCVHLRSDERFQDEDSAVASLAALLKSTTEVTGTLPGFVGDGASKKIADPNKELLSLLSDGEKTGSLPNTLESLSYSAATVRDRLSSDMLRVINSLDDHHDELQALQHQSSLLESATLNSAIDTLNSLLFSIAALSGLTRENMTQGDGWRFLQIGKRLERA